MRHEPCRFAHLSTLQPAQLHSDPRMTRGEGAPALRSSHPDFHRLSFAS